MRHRKKGRKLGRSPSHRKAMLRNMARNLLIHERIVTTAEKAKETRPYVEKLITIAKKGLARRAEDRAAYLHAYRRVLGQIQSKDVVQKLFGEGAWREHGGVAARYANRPGGYTRILRLGGSRMGTLVGQTGEVRKLEYSMNGLKPEPIERKLRLVGNRLGDNATRVMFELVEAEGKPKEQEPKAAKPKVKPAETEQTDEQPAEAQDQAEEAKTD